MSKSTKNLTLPKKLINYSTHVSFFPFFFLSKNTLFCLSKSWHQRSTPHANLYDQVSFDGIFNLPEAKVCRFGFFLVIDGRSLPSSFWRDNVVFFFLAQRKTKKRKKKKKNEKKKKKKKTKKKKKKKIKKQKNKKKKKYEW